MVCAKCEAKLPKLVVKDKWAVDKTGATQRKTSSGSGPIKGGGAGAATSTAAAASPLGASGLRPCRVCKNRVHIAGAFYCQQCAYRNGICAMCGVKVLDTTGYKQSST